MTSLLRDKLLEVSNSPPTLSNEERLALMEACDKAKLALETPLDTTIRIMFGGFESVSLRLAVDMQLIDQAMASKGPVTANELSLASGADAILVVRIMRMLVAMGIFNAEKPSYTCKPLFDLPCATKSTHFPYGASQIPPIVFLPEYFEQKGYKNPTDADGGSFQFTYQSKQHFFDWLSARPRLQGAFNTTMGIQRMERGETWLDYYPVEGKLRANADGILLVDVGGSVGHDVIKFQQRFPNLPGRLIFEDFLTVVSSATDLAAGIEAISHDFFRPHPASVRGAKAYYLRTVLHDWPDKQALTILRHIRDVMAQDSVLLIDENVMPDENVALYQASLDLIMMGVFASLDRTVKQFEELLDAAGLSW
ncbi:S-adenosyl-L-methionine-dependent methyltransferase [Massariosphaeria phaeospora]|uniref:S-adenosyl-L-methionine-dependent methyltransferase n=1 Tax=Massariosphaeria phaeospora TaxID=100035 RepID=A0A7C8MGB5_9PLEO|nr:S-adenosyl-L-methionine-dependent methyltransferase [Massariosphaeria phaeospora]